ncbi:Hypothetical predicted protein [Pelobates cultripes]|uniref:Uncharacterized protein n=1 Tax=Pelobates cultripes TaxID=61616 RepID=A0AAD1RXM2_PELCU|nr:Hypothetical predicted protein [Pelobates cultripes]
MLGKLEAAFQTKMEAMSTDITQVSFQVDDLEEERDILQVQITNFSTTMESHTLPIHRHRVGLDNRSRRNNLRIKSLPEDQGENVASTLAELFNYILGEASDNQILLDRAHRLLRPRGSAVEAPRDVICHVHYFAIRIIS